MDLETIGKKMLETLAVKGQLAGKEAKLVEIKNQIAKAEEAIKVAKETKDKGIASRKVAEEYLAQTKKDKTEAEGLVEKAEEALRVAGDFVGRATLGVDKFNDEALAKLEVDIADKQAVKQAIEFTYEDELAEAAKLKKTLGDRQAELKAEGVEFDISGAKIPKTTIL